MAVTTRPYWPTMSDYQEAVQSPPISFTDSELQKGAPVLNKLGLPRPICGQFASVYEIETGNRRCAIKCFLRNIPDQHDRYARISEHLSRHRTPYFVTFEYQNKGIRLRGEVYPLVKMEWIEGLPLNRFIENQLSTPLALLELEKRWLALLGNLRDIGIAHGDLQHGNVLVAEDGSLRLIDYDGMWVPALKSQRSHETGHPDYQSPKRGDRDFHADIDLFAGAVIQVAIRALGQNPALWERFDNGENLLFRRQDYLNPSRSPLVSALRSLGDDVINERLGVIINACAALPKPGQVGKGAAKSRNDGKGKASRKSSAENAKSPKKGAQKGTAKRTDKSTGARAASEPSTRRKPWLSLFIHVIVLTPVVFPSVAQWFDFVVTDASAMTPVQIVLFRAAAVFGVLSLATLLVFRRHHHRMSALLFGLMVPISAYDLSGKLWTIGSPATLEENLYYFGFSQLILVVSGLGWILRPDADKIPARGG